MAYNFVRVAGGLGNQLFQVAFGLNLGGDTIFFHFNDVDVLLLNRLKASNENLVVRNFRKKWILKYTLNASYRIARRPNNIFTKFAEVLISLCASLHFGKRIKFKLPGDTGFTKDMEMQSQFSRLFVGYFQSPLFFRTFDPFQIIEFSESELKTIEKYTELSNQENPVVIQVRLGDYLSEENFGVPSSAYFSAATKEVNDFAERKVWLFTNDIPYALQYLPRDILLNSRIIDEPNASSLLMLRIMTLGRDFIISNSTFGWWGAYLRYDRSGKVFYPTPWFKKIAPPAKLIPAGWREVQAKY